MMTNLTAPIAPHITVLINGLPVGALQYYSEKTLREVKLLRSIGSAENQGFYIGASEYAVHLRYIMPKAATLVESSNDAHGLQNFTLRIAMGDSSIVFEACEYVSLETSCTIGGSIVCEAVIHALRRAETR